MKSLTVGTILLTASVAMAGGLPAAPDLMPVKMLKPAKHAPVKLVRKGAPCAVVYVADAAPSVTLKRLVDDLSLRFFVLSMERPGRRPKYLLVERCGRTRLWA